MFEQIQISSKSVGNVMAKRTASALEMARLHLRLKVPIACAFALIAQACAFEVPNPDAKKLPPVEQHQAISTGLLDVSPPDVLAHNFLRDGRPANAFALRYARDAAVCSNFLAAMSEPRQYSNDKIGIGGDSRAANDVFLGSHLTVPWDIDYSTNIWRVETDIDHDGLPDHLYHRKFSLSGVDYDALYYGAVASADGDIAADFVTLQREPSKIDRSGSPASGIVLDSRTIDFGGAEPAPFSTTWSLGQYTNAALIGGQPFLVTGGNSQRLLERDWFPVRLIEVLAPDRHRLICELLPKFRQI